MNAKERIFFFRRWIQQCKECPERFKIIRMAPEIGTFGIATLENKKWKVRFYLPPWKKEEIISL